MEPVLLQLTGTAILIGNRSVILVEILFTELRRTDLERRKWQKDIFYACVDAMATGNIPHLQYPVIQEYDHIEQGEFSKEEAIKKLQRRMQKNNL